MAQELHIARFQSDERVMMEIALQEHVAAEKMLVRQQVERPIEIPNLLIGSHLSRSLVINRKRLGQRPSNMGSQVIPVEFGTEVNFMPSIRF